MIIRAFTNDDNAAVAAIHRASHPFPWPPGRFQAFSTLVAEVAGRIVAFACHSVVHAPDREECLLLANLAVDPAHRRRGIGRALLEARLRIAAAARIGMAMTITRVSNEPLRALYRHYGFEEGVRLPGYYGGCEDGLVLERGLDLDAEPPWRNAAPSDEDRTPSETLSAAIEASRQGQSEQALNMVDGLIGYEHVGSIARGYRAHILDALEWPVEAALELERLINETSAPWAHQALGDRYLAACLHGLALAHLPAAIPLAPAEPNPRLVRPLGVA